MNTPKQSSSSAPGRWTPLALGFRPFFLLSACTALLAVALWPALWRGALALPAYYDPMAWHAHEMLFGYTVAVVAGFLLTAVRNWTGVETWTGGRLGLLIVVWLLGRILPWFPGMPAWLLVAADLAFLPLLAASLLGPLSKGQNRVNLVFVPLLLLMALVNLV